MTVVTYGSGVTTALAAADRVDADVEVVDLRTIWPLDEETILASVEKTSRVLVLQEAARSTGAAGADPLADRAPLVRAPRRAACAARPAGHAGAVRARARGRVHAVRRLDAAALDELLAY